MTTIASSGHIGKWTNSIEWHWIVKAFPVYSLFGLKTQNLTKNSKNPITQASPFGWKPKVNE